VRELGIVATKRVLHCDPHFTIAGARRTWSGTLSLPQKRTPRLRWRPPAARQALRHRRLADVDAQLQLTLAGSKAGAKIVPTHYANQLLGAVRDHSLGPIGPVTLPSAVWLGPAPLGAQRLARARAGAAARAFALPLAQRERPSGLRDHPPGRSHRRANGMSNTGAETGQHGIDLPGRSRMFKT
jgi:hypothetical protein